MVEIVSYHNYSAKERAFESIKEIFFDAAKKKDFAGEDERLRFFHKWTSVYFEEYQKDIYLACEGEEILGYLMGCENSRAAQMKIAPLNSSYTVFSDQFVQYPAHLHINLSALSRGKGVGSNLISHYVAELSARNINGLHLVTSPSERNVGFYRKNGFTCEIEREFKGFPLLFMGRQF